MKDGLINVTGGSVLYYYFSCLSLKLTFTCS